MAGTGDVFKLYEAKAPEFIIETRPGVAKSYDPFKIARALEPLAQSPKDATFSAQIEVVKKTFDLPAITDAQAWAVLTAFRLFMEQVAEAKKV